VSKLAKGRQLEAFACGPRVVLISCGCPRRHIALDGTVEPLCGEVEGSGQFGNGHPKGHAIQYKRWRSSSPKMPAICQACIAKAPRAIFVREDP
jgi:hypothetical protein